MQLGLCKKYKFAVVFELYLLGRKLAFSSRIKNTDQLLNTTILMLLANQSLCVSDLAQRISIKLSTVSEKVNALEKQGLLFKTKVSDSRIRALNITNEGKAVLEAFYKKLPINRLEESVTLSKLEAATLMSLLAKVRI